MPKEVDMMDAPERESAAMLWDPGKYMMSGRNLASADR